MKNNQEQVSIVLFDDVYYVYNSSTDGIDCKSVLDIYDFLKEMTANNTMFQIYTDLPYVLIPEKMYESDSDAILLNQKYPHLLPAANTINVDTWTSNYTKCIYYVPHNLQKNKNTLHHLYSLWSTLNSSFFDKYSNAVWSLKIHNKQFVFIKSNNELKEVRAFDTLSPDDSTFHILKMIEPYRKYQHDFALWTNEQEPLHVSILSRYIPQIEVEKKDTKFIIKEILASRCASLQEI